MEEKSMLAIMARDILEDLWDHRQRLKMMGLLEEWVYRRTEERN